MKTSKVFKIIVLIIIISIFVPIIPVKEKKNIIQCIKAPCPEKYEYFTVYKSAFTIMFNNKLDL